MSGFLLHGLLILMLSASSMTQTSPDAPCQSASADIVAARISAPVELNAGHPSKEWERATPISFCEDWQGKNAAPERATVVRILWSPEMLYLRFECRYTQVTVFADSEPNGRRNHLWDRDVAETFLQPDPSREKRYKEFEVAPNGMWIDLDIGTGELVDLKSGLRRSVALDEKAHRWTAELAIPMKALTANFDPKAEWRTNFFRVEGAAEPRYYSAWQATNTEQPNFHVPKAFGRMRFEP
jgi:alpha-galactosidase